jgi:hypothetical protein
MTVKGGTHTEESKQKIRKARAWQVMKPVSKETKNKIGNSNKGKPRTKEWIDNLSKSHKGKVQSPEQIAKRVASLKGRIPWNKGIPQDEATKQINRKKNTGRRLSPEVRQLLREQKLGKPRSEEHNKNWMESRYGGFWYGAVIYLDSHYCEKWTSDLRERCRAFWDYKCFECGTSQKVRRLAVHHIHYNKKLAAMVLQMI